MTETVFRKFIKQCALLDEDRRTNLLKWASFLLPKERNDLVKFLEKSQHKWERLNKKIKQVKAEYQESMNAFLRQDVPEMLKKFETKKNREEIKEIEEQLKNI